MNYYYYQYCNYTTVFYYYYYYYYTINIIRYYLSCHLFAGLLICYIMIFFQYCLVTHYL
jgi:hypothetical protein